jgi:hypothetical protein
MLEERVQGRDMDDDRIKLGVLWKNVSRGNKPYLAGRVQRDNLEAAVQLLRDGGRFLVLGNTKRPDKQDPDYQLLVVPERGGDGGDRVRSGPDGAAARSPTGQQRTDPGARRGR